MKVFNKINIALAGVALMLSSCGNDWLDLAPYDAVDAETAITSSEDIANIRVGLYQALKGSSDLVDYYGRLMFVYGDVRGEDIQTNHIDGSGRSNFYYYMNYKNADNFGSTTSSATAIWQTPFLVINRANSVIDGCGLELTDAEEAAYELAQYKAEAQVLRAMALFDLTRIYGVPFTKDNGASLGVPVITETLPSTAKPARNTVAECYAQIEKDLNEAINSEALMDYVDADNFGYVNLWAAKALLVRVYLTKGEWKNALDVASDIIDNSPFQLWSMEDYAGAWSKLSSAHFDEVMFEISINNSTDWTDREGIAYCMAEESSRTPGYSELIATKKFVELITEDANDVRNNVLLPSEIDAERGNANFGGAAVYVNKMPEVKGDVRYSNVPLLRLSEVYLAAAEAAFNLNQKAEAAKYLNALLENRTSTPEMMLAEDGSDITYDRIKTERRKELIGEGQRYFDILRTGDNCVRYTNDSDKGWHDVLTEEARSFNRDSKKALPLIPTAEINANPNMQQNPLY